MDVLFVVPVEPLGAGYLDRDAVNRFADIKGRTLGYIDASINTPLGPRQYKSSPAPLGAVVSQEDANRLVAALANEFPRVAFRMETRPYPESEHIIWHHVGLR